jgi:hypothetical protein
LFFKGYTQQEASEELEIPLGTVKTQIEIINDLRTYLVCDWKNMFGRLLYFTLHSEIKDEIIAIEKNIVALSSSFSPFHSVANYEKSKLN